MKEEALKGALGEQKGTKRALMQNVGTMYDQNNKM